MTIKIKSYYSVMALAVFLLHGMAPSLHAVMLSKKELVNKALDDYERQQNNFRLQKREPEIYNQETNKKKDHWDIFLEKLNYGVIVQSKQKPQMYLEALLPLSTSENRRNVLFSQARLNYRDGHWTQNSGIGFRHMNQEETVMMGINSFLDRTSRNKHYRASVGWELAAYNFESRGNSYIGLTNRKTIKETGTSTTYEEVANGYDAEIGGNVLSNEALKIYFGYSHFDLPNSGDQKGWRTRAEIKPLPFTKINLESFNQDGDDTEFTLDGRFHLPVHDFTPKEILASVREYTNSQNKGPATVAHKMYNRVERENNIIVDRWTTSPPTTSGTMAGSVELLAFASFPSRQLPDTDPNANGFIDPGETFEINIQLTNNTTTTVSNISYSNGFMTITDGMATTNVNPFANDGDTLTEPGGDDDADPGETVRTDNVEDLDFVIPGGTSAGALVTFTVDITYDGNTQTVRFGSGVVGAMTDNQTYNRIF